MRASSCSRRTFRETSKRLSVPLQRELEGRLHHGQATLEELAESRRLSIRSAPKNAVVIYVPPQSAGEGRGEGR